MQKAIGMIEFKTVASGITAADQMVKTSEVEVLEAQVVCPGKYIALISGDLSAVKAAIEAAEKSNPGESDRQVCTGKSRRVYFPGNLWHFEY